MKRNENTTQPNQSSQKLLKMLEFLSEQTEPIRLQDLAGQLDMNPSTAIRFLKALQSMDYVAQDLDNDRYYLTYKICAVANNVASRSELHNLCMPYLRSISQIYGESANLSIEQDMMVVYIDVVNGPNQLLRTMQRIGSIAPMHCTGVGKLMLLNYTDQQIDQLIAAKGLPKFTENTRITKESLLEELEAIRLQGYAFDNEECEVGARCIAVPIRNYTGRIVAGLSVSGPTTRMTDEHIFGKMIYLLDAAQQISQRLGYDSSAPSAQ